MKVVFTSDWHGDWTTAGVSRFDEVEAAVEASVDYAQRIRAGLYVFSGDLAETEGPGMLRTLELAVRTATRLNTHHIQSLWLTGNHDVIEDGLRTSTLNPLRDVPGATLADGPMMIPFGQPGNPPGQKLIQVCALPFTPRTHDYDPDAFVREQQLNNSLPPDLVVGHLMLEGIGPGSETRDMPRGRNVFFPLERIRHTWPNALLVNGHYHTSQLFNGIYVPGSLVRLMQVEASNRPVWMEATL